MRRNAYAAPAQSDGPTVVLAPGGAPVTLAPPTPACHACAGPIEPAGLERTPRAWLCQTCREARVPAPPVTSVWTLDRRCLWHPAPLEVRSDVELAATPGAPSTWCSGCGSQFFAYELRCREWVLGRTERGTPTFGEEHWPIVRRGLEVELRDRFHTGDPVADAVTAAHLAIGLGWFEAGRTGR